MTNTANPGRSADAPPPLLVDSVQAGKLLCLSPRTIWSLASSGQLRRLKVGRSVRFAVSDLERFIATRQEGGQR